MTAPAPLDLYRGKVLPEWIDYNNHMNVAYYLLVFDQATDVMLDHLGMDGDYRQREQCSVFTLEAHINYLQELEPDAPMRCTSQLLDHDPKKIHYFHHLYHAERDYLAATNELMLLHVDMGTRRSAPMRDPLLSAVQAMAESHRGLPRPQQAGSVIGIRRNPR